MESEEESGGEVEMLSPEKIITHIQMSLPDVIIGEHDHPPSDTITGLFWGKPDFLLRFPTSSCVSRQYNP
ncbi:centromere protein X isoform X3 [Sesbania bispinosa]|nr:centromere protein X isoform X3 [Sesbania bispinosa]